MSIGGFLGDTGGVGAEGAWDALRNIIATRKKDEILAQQEADRQRQFSIQEAQNREAEKWRELQFQGLQDERNRQNEDRDAARKQAEEIAKQAATDREAGIIRTRLETLAPGYTGNAQDLMDAQKVGMGGLYTPNPIDPNHPEAAQTFKKGATWAQQKEIQNDLDRKQAALDMADLRRELAKASQGQKPAYYTPVPVTGSPLGIMGFDARTNRLLNPELPPGTTPQDVGTAGPAARTAMTTAAPIAAFINSLDALETVGEKYDWKGLGIPQGIQGMMARSGLVTPPKGMIEMQAAVADVNSLIGHARYGSALTEGEKAKLNAFVADAYTPGKITREMVQSVKNIELDVLRRTMSGPFGPVHEQNQQQGEDKFGVLDLFGNPKP